MSYKAEFSTDCGETYATNALRFATELEAQRYAENLALRWLAVTDYRTAESGDEINYEIADGQIRAIK